jgi:hypothetical protein
VSHKIECNFCGTSVDWGSGQKGWFQLTARSVIAFAPLGTGIDMCPDCHREAEQRGRVIKQERGKA